MNIFLCAHLPLDATPEKQHDTLIEELFNGYEVQAFWRRYRPDMRVIAGYEISEEEPRSPVYQGDYNYPEMVAAYATWPVQFDGEPTHWHMHGGYSHGLCGRARKSGNKGMTFSGCSFSTMEHETGHNGPGDTGRRDGCGHANKRTLTAEGYRTDEYDGDGVQAGKNGRVPLFNGPHCAVIGYREAVEITESREVLLCPLHLRAEGRHPNEVPLVRVGSMHFYSWDGRRIYCNDLLASASTVLYGVAEAGETIPLLNGVALENLGSMNGTVKAGITIDGNVPIPVDMPATMFPEVE